MSRRAVNAGSRGEGTRLVVVIRATQRLLQRLPGPIRQDPQESTCALGDWYANLITINRKPLVLAMSSKSLLPTLFPARGLFQFKQHFLKAVEQALLGVGASPEAVAVELREMQEVAFAPTASRSVVGCLVDMGFHAQAHLEEEANASLVTVSRRLAEIPFSPLGMSYPRKAALALLSRTPHLDSK